MSASERSSDDELMAAIAAGDRDAFAALYRRRRPDVYRFAVHMTGVPQTAEDVAQDVFMAIIRDAARYKAGRSGVVPWLLGIARNHVRRRAAQDRFLDPLSDVLTPASKLTVTIDPVEGMTRDQDIAAVRTALRSLPFSYREVVVLCDLQELSYADAAESIGCAIGTVRSRLHRGRALLSARLKGERRSATRRAIPGWVL